MKLALLTTLPLIEQTYSAHVCSSVATATDEVLITDGSHSFDSTNAWCEYHCHPAYQRDLHRECPVLCLCDMTSHRYLTVDDAWSIPLVHCSNNMSSEVHLTDPSSAGTIRSAGSAGWSLGMTEHPSVFFKAFREHYAELLAAESDSKAVACKLMQLSENLSAEDDDTMPQTTEAVPTLVNLKATLTCSLASVNALVLSETSEIVTDNGNGSVLMVLVHANYQEARAIDALTCVTSVFRLPAILKLRALAQSWSSRVRDDIPVLEIQLNVMDKSASELIAADLNRKIASLSGAPLTPIVPLTQTQYGIENVMIPGFLVLPPLTQRHLWAQVLSILMHHPSVSSLDVLPVITTSVLPSDSPLKIHPDHRRLDPFDNDVLNVTAAIAAGLAGQGHILAVSDTGLYMDHDQFDQPQRDIFNSVDQQARKVVSYDAFVDALEQSTDITCGHGTHVAAIAIGSSNSGSSDNIGIAPAARLAFKDLGSQPAYCQGELKCPVPLTTPIDPATLFGAQRAAGASIFSFSWGTPGNDYSSLAQMMDQYLYDNPEVIVVVAAGNSGDQGSQTIASPAGAKNVITVGASLNGAGSFGRCSESVNNENSVAVFSSQGPTSDGRIKPDLVAPGQLISSARSLATGKTAKTSEMCDLQGTSQSAPGVAGVVILISQWLKEGWYNSGTSPDPTFAMTNVPSSLVKGLLIHSSQALRQRLTTTDFNCGNLASTALPLSFPDMNQGYGRPNFGALFGKKAVWFLPNHDEEIPSINENGKHMYNFTVMPGEIFRVTLVWTDRAGSLSGARMLQHDLDLSAQVVGSNRTIFPLSSVDGASPDRLNNVEMIQASFDVLVNDLPSSNTSETERVTSLVITVAVFGTSVAGTDQEYSLVSSSGSIGSIIFNGIAQEEFLQDWMTYAIIILVGGIFVVYCWYRCYQKRPDQRRRPQTSRYAATARQGTGFHPSNVPFERQVNPSAPSAFSSAVVNPEMTKCPYCRFESGDPFVMIDHVEKLHEEAQLTANVSSFQVPSDEPLSSTRPMSPSVHSPTVGILNATTGATTPRSNSNQWI